MFLNFSTEREFDSHLYMFSLDTREWETILGEGGISLQCCVSMMCKHEDDLLYRDLCSRKIKKSKVHDKSVIIVARNGSERNDGGLSEVASF